ncbi:MAG: COX15/CtaA family protein [Fulvivirga sp.]|nr:COX15/CtaA family protein [Fulvivirga sp.]
MARLSLVTLVAVYFLILVGGIVRSTGSGMGCPDWPKCFGQWIPPTSKAELPDNYKEIYSGKRQQKNERFAKYLTALGFENTANKLLSDESIKEESDFNKIKTWTEYINRLIGVIIGLLIIATFLYSIPFVKKDRKIFVVALATLLLVIFQGWIGSIVVSTNLLPWMITIHMFLALAIVALLVYIVYKTNPQWRLDVVMLKKSVPYILVACMVLLLMQIALGTQVRESVDEVAASMNYNNRGLWIENLGTTFLIHRSFSWVILLLHGLLFYLVYRSEVRSLVVNWLMVIILLSAITGVTLNYMGFPAAIQPVHLLLATVAFGMQFLLFLQLVNKRALKEVHQV